MTNVAPDAGSRRVIVAVSPLSVYVYAVTQPIASVTEPSRPDGSYAFEVSTKFTGEPGAFGSPV
ncbi:hypothetical protein GCM10009558_052480 [Virgisporangium aurantiacum]